MSLADFHFLRPYWLVLLVPLLVLVVKLRNMGGSTHLWKTVCDQELLPHVLTTVEGGQRRSMTGLGVGLIGLLGIVALAGPVWERLPQPVFNRQSALVIALDLSLSMYATDITPSRLERARFKVADILKRRHEGQTALIVFAAQAFTVTPLTDDARTIATQLPVLTPAIMPNQGSRPDRALELAYQLLQQSGATVGDVLLITDGIEPEAEANLAALGRKGRWRVSVLGAGTAAGAPIPVPGSGFLQDKDGQVITARLHDQSLSSLAGNKSGTYAALSMDDSDLERVERLIDTLPEGRDLQQTEFQADRWREQGPWLVLAALMLALAGFRRGYLMLVAAMSMSLPVPADAAWADWWLRPDQQAQQAMNKGDTARAEALYQDPLWRGTAQYRNGKFEQALENWRQDDSADGLYNRANALAKLGRLDEAIKAYDQALAKAPDHADARYNRDLLRQQQQKQKQDQASNGQSQDDSQEADGSSDADNKNNGGTSPADKQQQQAKQSDAGDEDAKEQDQSGSAAPGDKRSAGNEKPTPEQQSKPERETDAQAAQADTETADKKAKSETQPQPTVTVGADAQPSQEGEQADEQWLRRIPDDPSGLLRRKFHYQYQRRNYAGEQGQGW